MVGARETEVMVAQIRNIRRTLRNLDETVRIVQNSAFVLGRATISEIDRQIQQINPVKTGKMVNNWLAGFNTPTVIETSFDSSNRRPFNAGPAGFPRRPVATAVSFHLTNSVDYADDIWKDGGRTAPPGWGAAIISNVVRKLNRLPDLELQVRRSR